MKAEHFFDDLARTLAEPMPRRRAVRVLGASLVALAVPGVSPRIARAARVGSDDVGPTSCPRGENVCSTYIDPNDWPKGQKHKCCPFPRSQWTCGGPEGYTCIDTCAATSRAIHKPTKATWSAETWPDGNPKRYNCCVLPDTIPSNGECLPNCKLPQYGGPFARACGKTCCPTYQLCVNGKCRPCEDFGGHSCQPYGGGMATCCPKGTNCCANKKTTACCGPKQTCRAQNRKQATCACDRGEKCGSDCCNAKKGEFCCNGLATRTCCKRGETCCSGQCCSGKAVCCDEDCCDPTQGDFCLHKQGKGAVCKKGCAPENRAGAYCCGTGYKPNPSRTKCVLA